MRPRPPGTLFVALTQSTETTKGALTPGAFHPHHNRRRRNLYAANIAILAGPRGATQVILSRPKKKLSPPPLGIG